MTRCASPRARSSAAMSAGRSSTAARITWAWARFTCSGRQRPPRHLVAVERRGEPEVGVGPAPLDPGVVGHPVRGRGRGVDVPDPVAVRRGEHPQLQLGQPGLCLLQAQQRLPLLIRGHRPRRRISQTVQRPLQTRYEHRHRMPRRRRRGRPATPWPGGRRVRTPRAHARGADRRRRLGAGSAAHANHARETSRPPPHTRSQLWTNPAPSRLWTKTGSPTAVRAANAAAAGRRRSPSPLSVAGPWSVAGAPASSAFAAAPVGGPGDPHR